MPLSEHEQRVLQELEQALYKQDPDFAARVRSENVYRYAGRYLKWSVAGFVVGLGVMMRSSPRRSSSASWVSSSCSSPW